MSRRPSYELSGASLQVLIAALEIDKLARGVPTDRSGLEALLTILDADYKSRSNVLFFQDVLEAVGISGLKSVDDVWKAVATIIKNLRAIEVFGTGNLASALNFSIELHKILLAHSCRGRRRFAA